MALAASLGCFAAALVIFLIAAAFGNRIMETASLVAAQPFDHLLLSAGIGFALLQLLCGVVSWSIGLTARSAAVLLLILAILGATGGKSFFHLLAVAWKDLAGLFRSGAAKILGIGSLFFLVLEFLSASAPLSGSDALHYHFTAPLLEIGRPEHAIFWLTHSFFVGLGHELIALGLVLAGDRLALLLIFFAGCLTSAALFQLARRLMPVEWALGAVLIFVMTPMVFWQISTAGSPDIWMGLYAVLTVLAVEQMSQPTERRWLIVAGACAGAGAGIKYTGWILPAALVLCALWLTRSVFWAALGAATAAVMGVLPAARNFLWTGDPFFPFLHRWMGKIALNPYGMAALQADVHSRAFSLQPLRILYFPALMVLRGADYGVGHYFGPVVLSFAPLLFFCDWKLRLTRIVAMFWLAILVANAFTTQMARFLLPAYPFALALVLAGAFAASRKPGAMPRLGCLATLAVYGLFCLGADSLYARDFLPVALGRESKEAFLNRMAPDYQAVAFLNSALAGRSGTALVFLWHSYYLRVPYEMGDPAGSWMANPADLASPQALEAFLEQQGIAWVVKSPVYPQPLNEVFKECEKEGLLIPEAQTETETLYGSSRTYNLRAKVPVVVLRVAK
jgi:4-amino-4-deoxy-L-arabinose transferase-like glycosyltransferase